VKSKIIKIDKSKPRQGIDWKLVDSLPDADKPDNDSPELTAEGASKLRPYSELANIGKTRITIMLDESIVQMYKQKAGGRGYQTLINETLRKGLEIDNVKDALREVLREELTHH
jgi:uncharacterized protein (DUF4415 family)